MGEELKALELLAGEHAAMEVEVLGEKHIIPIRQIKTGKIPKLLRAAGPLMVRLGDRSQPLDINQLFMFHTEDCLNMLSVLIDRPREFVDEMEVEDSVKLITACLECNVDFFVRRILPLLEKQARQLTEEFKARGAKGSQSVGLKQPSTSLAQGTESPTSGNTSTESSSAILTP